MSAKRARLEDFEVKLQSCSVFHNILSEFILPAEVFTDNGFTLGKRNMFTYFFFWITWTALYRRSNPRENKDSAKLMFGR